MRIGTKHSKATKKLISRNRIGKATEANNFKNELHPPKQKSICA